MARDPQTGTPSLHLPQDVGIGEQATLAVTNRWNTLPKVDAELARRGMPTNNEPDIQWRPITVELLLTTKVEDFTTLFAQQLRWKNYVTRLLADARAKLLELKNQMDNIEMDKKAFARKYNATAAKSDKLSTGDIELMVYEEPAYRELKLEQQEQEQLRMKLEAWSEELEFGFKMVSRQIENRRADGVAGTREGNMPAHASGNSWQDRKRGGF